ncbi:MAG: BamA/TamA family outer membrane protein [Burkholderiales bacterium]|nr:BamA/TamA family outer membrane protein [Burkholderiales bacterium]
MILRRTAGGLVAMLIMTGWFVAALAQETGYAWRIELDAPPDVQPLLEKHMDIYRYRGRPEVDAALLNRLVARAAADARQLLTTEGYFSPQVDTRSAYEQGVNVVHIRVVPGEAARVVAAEVRVTGAIADDPGENTRIAPIRERWRLPAGSAFRQSAWDDAKDALLREFIFDGYPAARVAASEALVDSQSGTVSLTVTVDSGPLFRFGPLEIIGLERYPRTIVENLSRIRAGERYTYDAMLRYQSELQASGFFESASVTVDPDPAHASSAPVVVRVTEYPVKKLDFSIGYSTDTGPRGGIAFTHHNTLRPGWQGLAKLQLDMKQQMLDGELALTPEASGWRNRLGLEAARSDVENLVTRRLGLTARRSWRTPEDEHDFALKFQTEKQAVTAGPVDNLKALTLNYSWTLRRVDDLLRPRRGYLLNLQLGGAAEPLLSTRSFVRGYTRALYIVPFGREDRLHLRGELGAVLAEARDGIPSEFLFRAGGDQSIRGYAYQSLGVPSGAAILGARYLGIATVEYQHDFTAQWGGALFVDAGNATDTLSGFRPVYGYGVGVRWITPAGAINFDIARAHETGKLRLHFTLGARF